MNTIRSALVVLLCASCASHRTANLAARGPEAGNPLAPSAVGSSNALLDDDLVAELQRVWGTAGTGWRNLGGGYVSPDSSADSMRALEGRDPIAGSARAGIGGELLRLRFGADGRPRLGPGLVVDDRHSDADYEGAVAWIGFSF